MKVLLGISGGIAAYKSAELVRLYQQQGWRVQAILTRSAHAFVPPLTFAALTGEKVLTDLFAPAEPVRMEAATEDETTGAIEHINVAQSASVLVVAPATAHVIARCANGLADDYLTTVFLACPAPVVMAPAMNSQMWVNPATQANLEQLRSRGAIIVTPGEGYLACGMVGAGRMADPQAILQATMGALQPADMKGETVLITAGPTREALDPVRYISNRSSGRMGFALAEAAARRGAQVLLVAGPTEIGPPTMNGIEMKRVTTAAEMEAAAIAGFERCTIAVLAAAVADYRPTQASDSKIKKSNAPIRLELEPTPDIMAGLSRCKGNRVLVGFAAETDAAGGVALARAKLVAKGADLVVYNDVSRSDAGFGSDYNAAVLVTRDSERELARSTKAEIAQRILDAIMETRRRAPAVARN